MTDFDGQIIDMHAHIYPRTIASRAVEAIGNFYGIPMKCDGVAETLLACGAAAGIGRYVIHAVATSPEQTRAINRNIANECEMRKGVFFGFGALHPAMKNLEEEVQRICKSGLAGVKLHPDFQKFAVDDPALDPLYAAICGRLPVLLHAGDRRFKFSNPVRIAAVARKFPKLRIIAAHFGGYSEWADAAKELYDMDVMFDTSSSLFALEPAKAKEMIRRAGVEKFMFGSDFPMWSPEEEFGRFMRLGLTDEENRLILWRNAERVLKIPVKKAVL